jgi:membrane fusion protein, copper/silver efflux system
MKLSLRVSNILTSLGTAASGVLRTKLHLKKAAAAVSAGLFVLLLIGVYVYRVPLASWILATSQEKTVQGDHGQTNAAKPADRRVLYWYDSMSPERHYDKPGKAPDGMDLVPKYAEQNNPSSPTGDMASMPGMDMPSGPSGGTGSALAQGVENMAPGTVMLNPATQQTIGVRYAEVRRAHLTRTVRTVGLVQMNDQKISHVHVKIAGWIQDIGVDYVGQMVKKGQFLFSVYSPDLVSTEQEYLIALRGQSYLGKAPYRDVSEGAQSLLHATRERLHLWDITDEQIEKLEKTGEVMRNMNFYSPVSGFVMDRKAFPQSWVDTDKELYTLADLSDVWVYVDVYEYEAPYVRLGQPASMQLSYFPGRTFRGRVDYVYPTLDPQTRTIKVRLDFSNPNYGLKPNMYADVQLNIDYGVQTVVPSEAVLNSGTRQVVFIAKPGGYFEPREIKVGNHFDGQYAVLAGLKPGEKIVTSGNFLIDSESRLGTAMQGMAGMPGMSSEKK